MGVLSRQLFEEPLFIKREAAQTPSFDAYQTPAQFSTQGGTLIEGTFPGIKAIRESIQQRSFEPVKKFVAESPALQPARTPQEVFERTLSLGLTSPGELTRFKGFKDLTTKFLDYAKGKIFLSKQEILDFAKRPELKKGEADLLNAKLIEFESVNLVKDRPFYVQYYNPKLGDDFELGRFNTREEARGFIEKQTGIKKQNAKIGTYKATGENKIPAQEFADSIRRDLLELKPVKVKEPQYVETSLDYTRYLDGTPTKPSKNYEEVVFESPITTNGSSHYPNSKNYFAHARGDEVVESGKKIWREQEIQSDLLQKDRLANTDTSLPSSMTSEEEKIARRLANKRDSFDYGTSQNKEWSKKLNDFLKPIAERDALALKNRLQELNKLDPFTNDRFGERIMRERIKEKARKGYEKYRIPTGETIGKIEGFRTQRWVRGTDTVMDDILTTENIKVGDTVTRSIEDVRGGDEHWIITDILGEGRFKAVQKSYLDNVLKEGVSSKKEIIERVKSLRPEMQETFDLTGKSNPQYTRYEKWGKFLKNKYGAKIVTDSQGNTWFEINLKPEYKKLPIEAFGIAPFLPRIFKTEQKEEEPLFIK